jgi:hypothetical protein
MVDLPEPDRPVNQSTAGLLMFLLGAGVAGDVERLPMDIGGAAQRKSIRPSATVALVWRSIRMKLP